MDNYNIKITKFDNSYRIKTYKNAIKTNENKSLRLVKKGIQSSHDCRFSENEEEVAPEEKERIKKLEEKRRKEEEQRKILNRERSIKSSINRTKNTIYDLAKSNKFSHFVTLTLSPEKIKDRYDYEECTKKVLKNIKYIKNTYDKEMYYIIIPEKHKDGAWHYHGLIGSTNQSALENALKLISDGIYHKGDKVYHISRYKLGWSDVTKIRDTQRASNYITKYITKELLDLAKNKKRYFSSKNLKKPEEIKILMTREDLQKFILEQEKKAFMDKDSYSKTIPINAPGYENEMSIYNFSTSYEEFINNKILNYFTTDNINIV